jgi:hypothetical protein
MSNRIIVELRRSEFQFPYQDNLENVLGQFAPQLQAAWNGVASLFAAQGVNLSLNRLLTALAPNQISAVQNRAQAISQQQPPDLFSLMTMDIAGPGAPIVNLPRDFRYRCSVFFD